MAIFVRESRINKCIEKYNAYGLDVPSRDIVKENYRKAKTAKSNGRKSDYAWLLDGYKGEGPNMDDFQQAIEFTASTSTLADFEYDPSLFIGWKTGTGVDTFISSPDHGGGLMPGTVTVVTGDGGVGKSSFLLWLMIALEQQAKTDLEQRCDAYQTSLMEDKPTVDLEWLNDKAEAFRAENGRIPRMVFISAEMDKLDLVPFLKYYPALADLNILYPGEYQAYVADPSRPHEMVNKSFSSIDNVLQEGYDIALVDSMAECLEYAAEEYGIRGKRAENMFLNLLEKHAKHAKNDRKVHTAFLVIQQQTKGGQFVGSNRLKHMTTAMMHLRKDDGKNGTNKSYIQYTKNRRNNNVGTRLFYAFVPTGIDFDLKKYEDTQKIASLTGQSNDSINDDDWKKIIGNDEMALREEEAGQLLSNPELPTDTTPEPQEPTSTEAAPYALDKVVRAGQLVIDNDAGSSSFIQQMMKVGFNEALGLLNQLEIMGVVGAARGPMPREVLMTRTEFDQLIADDTSADGFGDDDAARLQHDRVVAAGR